VEDGAAAYMLLAEELHRRPELSGKAFNFSNELEITVLQLVGRILRAMDSTLEPLVLNQASNEIRRQYLSAERARQMLAWSPLFNLETGMERTIRWYRDFLCGERIAQPAGSLAR
jgi:CDP-glucose 4,6-dehydratase